MGFPSNTCGWMVKITLYNMSYAGRHPLLRVHLKECSGAWVYANRTYVRKCSIQGYNQVGGHMHTQWHTRAVIEAGEIGENYTGEKVWPISPPALCAQINPQPLLEQMNYYFVLCVQQHPYWCQKMTWFVFFFFFFFLLCCSFFWARHFI